jgi:hypothetical protein
MHIGMFSQSCVLISSKGLGLGSSGLDDEKDIVDYRVKGGMLRLI